jgi:hypothetical protein
MKKVVKKVKEPKVKETAWETAWDHVRRVVVNRQGPCPEGGSGGRRGKGQRLFSSCFRFQQRRSDDLARDALAAMNRHPTQLIAPGFFYGCHGIISKACARSSNVPLCTVLSFFVLSVFLSFFLL